MSRHKMSAPVTSQASGFLGLPLELRLKIYEELLCPDPTRVYELYHDRYGKTKWNNIYPAILRVNKEIYHHAINLLYSRNAFEISLRTPMGKTRTLEIDGAKASHTRTFAYLYDDSISNPPDIIRRDFSPTLSIETTCPSSLLPLLERNRGCVYDLTHPGILYPHCLKRLRHISILTSAKAIGGRRTIFSRPTHVGNTILELLVYLARETDMVTGKSLSFTLIDYGKIKFRQIPPHDHSHWDDMIFEIAELLECIQKTRVVKVLQSSNRKTTGEKYGKVGLEGYLTNARNVWEHRRTHASISVLPRHP